ncbi:MAG: PaaI family thioesterase [Ilumatobacteraceae bacterium]
MADGSFTFPSFHSRDRELSQADEARISLADTVRKLVYQSFTSTADVEKIDEAMALIEDALTLLEQTGQPGSAAAESHFSDRSPFYGAMNPLSMPMIMTIDQEFGEFGAVMGDVVFTEPYEGPPGHCHGGFIAAAFDEVLGMTQSLTGRPGMTGRLSVTYRSPTPLHAEIHFKGWVEKVDGRKIFTKGTAHHGDKLCAEAEVLFLSMPPEMMDLLRKGRDLNPS